MAEAAEYDGQKTPTLRQKWDSEQCGTFTEFATEFVSACEGL